MTVIFWAPILNLLNIVSYAQILRFVKHFFLLGRFTGYTQRFFSKVGKHFFILKVPKREIFDRSDFPDFYTMKSLRVGDFGVKIK